MKKTDHSHFTLRLELRLESLKKIRKQKIRVIDCFAGDGLLWDKIKKDSSKDIDILKIEKKRNARGIYLMGDNVKFLRLLNLDRFDIIDLDAYGSPYRQLNEIFKKNYQGIVICTFCQTGMGGLNKKMIEEIGYSKEMIDKIPTLFNKNGMEKLSQYLALKGVKKIIGYFINNKNYFYFNLHN